MIITTRSILMNTYEKIIEYLLFEENIKDLPDDDILKKGLVIADGEGFKHTIMKVGLDKNNKKLYKIKCKDEVKIIDAKEIKEYERA
jgi:hypothetical protein